MASLFLFEKVPFPYLDTFVENKYFINVRVCGVSILFLLPIVGIAYALSAKSSLLIFFCK